MDFFVSCPKGIESLLFDELTGFGLGELSQTVAGVYFQGNLQQAYHVMMWSRLANQLLLQLHSGPVKDQQELYDVVASVDWPSVFPVDSSFSIKFSGSNEQLKDTRFSTLKTKDAIVDVFRAQLGSRPDVDNKTPQITIHARLHRSRLALSVDIAGGSLHRRAYREKAGRAPLKENLAAAVLHRAGWPGNMQRHFVDPLCGTGTLVIEAALMQADIAPGLLRNQQLNSWRGHRPALWNSELSDARQRRTDGLTAASNLPRLSGFDQHYMSVKKAIDAARIAGIENRVHFQQQSIENTVKPKKAADGLLVSNLPYGQRLGNPLDLILLARQIGTMMKQFDGWHVALLASGKPFTAALPYRWDKSYQLYNGPLEVELFCFAINDENLKPADKAYRSDFRNRLEKNIRKSKSWLKRIDSDCYRIYDADIPEFAVSIDIYREHIHIAEYRAPASVSETEAAARLEQVLVDCMEIFQVSASQLHLKQRQKQKGKSQYYKQQEEGDRLVVTEGQVKFLVNLDDYLDTGLFLDHRSLRRRVASEAKARTFLNLFCYTATASVHAANAGARCTSVDMSNTYILWAKENFRLNDLDLSSHRFIRADILHWLDETIETAERWDMIMLDPPSFSNSKSMTDSFDVQRDHGSLIEKTMKLLSKTGVLYFSNNRKGFKLDKDLMERFSVEDITGQTYDPDFSSGKKIHRCYRICHKPDAGQASL